MKGQKRNVKGHVENVKGPKEGLDHDVNARTQRSSWIGWRPAEMALTSWMRMWPQSWTSSALTSSTLQIIRQVSKCIIQHKMSSTQCGVRCFYPWLLSTEEKVSSIKIVVWAWICLSFKAIPGLKIARYWNENCSRNCQGWEGDRAPIRSCVSLQPFGSGEDLPGWLPSGCNSMPSHIL